MPVQWIRDFAQQFRRARPARRLRRPQLQGEVLETRLALAATVLTPIADMTIASSQSSATLDLLQYLGDNRIGGTVTKWTIMEDDPQTAENEETYFYVDLFDSITPITVRNFLDYVAAGAYNHPTQGDTFFHRSEKDFVLQGGGFRWNGVDDNAIDTFAQIPNEFAKIRAATPTGTWVNTRGTIAMAKTNPPEDPVSGGPLNGGPDSATNQWFFNLRDNGSNLDTQNGGFTTFGKVLFDGMTVVDALAALPYYNQPSPLGGGQYAKVPLRNYTSGQALQSSNLATVKDISIVPELTFQVIANSNSGLVTASIQNGRLTLNHQGSATGSATITVRATDLTGGTVDETFVVTFAGAGNRAPTVSQAIPDTGLAEADVDRTLSYNLATRFADADLGSGDALTYSIVSNTNPRLVTTTLSGGSFTAKINADQNGAATITVRATDKTGSFVEDTFVVTISAVNNAPEALVSIGNRTYLEDPVILPFNMYQVDVVDAQNNQFKIPMFTDTDLYTSKDDLVYSVSANSNPGLITTTVAGQMMYFDAVPNAHGTANLTIRATDKGGLFAEISFSVTVNPVNDAPSFTLAAEHGSAAGAGAQSVPNFATNVSAGPNESSQTLNFEIVSYTNPSLFVTPPTISANGTLNYQLVNNKLESSQVTVRLKDNGGTANGGVDQSGLKTFVIFATNPWQNPLNRFDVDGIAGVNAFDVLALVNEVRNPVYANAARQLPFPRAQAAAPYFDVDGVLSGGKPVVSAFDVLDLVNYIRSQPAPTSQMSAASSDQSSFSSAGFAAPSVADPPEQPFDATFLLGGESPASAYDDALAALTTETPRLDEDETFDPLAVAEVFSQMGADEEDADFSPEEPLAELPLTLDDESEAA